MINSITRFFRKLINWEFRKDIFVNVDPHHEHIANYWNGPVNW